MIIKLVQTDDRNINQLQQNVKQAVEPQFSTPYGTFQAFLSGCTTSPQVKASWQRGSLQSALTLSFPSLTGTSNTAAATITGLPTLLWPASAQTVLVHTIDNGTDAIAIAVVSVTGTITLYKSLTSAIFTTSGLKGLGPCCITYVAGI